MSIIEKQEKRLSFKELRIKMGLTQSEMAELLEKSRSSIAKKEAGKVKLQIDELKTLREKGINLEHLEI